MKKILYFVLGLLLFSACKQQDHADEKENHEAETTQTLQLTPAQIKNGNIVVGEVKTTHITSTINLHGVIDVPPQNMVSITCPMGGYIKKIDLLPGQEVDKGEVLITMEDPSYIQIQQDYLVGKSRLEYLQKEAERQATLAETEAASQKSYQLAKADYETQRITLHALEAKLQLMGINAQKLTPENISAAIGIRSPIHGFISKVSANKGRYVNPTETLAELVDPSDIHASITVFEKDISYIKKDQAVMVSLVSNPDKKYPAGVLLVTRNINADKSGMVHCHFHKYDPALVPGMAIMAQIELEDKAMPAVPEPAVVLWQGKHFVFVETAPNKFEMMEVETGPKENGMIALVNTKQDWAGKKVATQGAFNLLGMLKNVGENAHAH